MQLITPKNSASGQIFLMNCDFLLKICQPLKTVKNPMRMLGATLFLLFFSYGESGPSDLADSNKLRDCYYYLLCTKNYTQEFYEITEKAGPTYKPKIWEWKKDISGADVTTENSVENWVKYRNKECALSEDERNRHFHEFGQISGEYGLVVCMNIFSPECKEVEEMGTVLAKSFEQYYENGECKLMDE
ncbi:uncharacterized protein LOC129956571 [Argiope bruennichi]|uniref:uncharacterized protein LOC129956571 n=1 Tax=Argiope bruennichi TaxID=94029 RepID=UPI002494F0D5|nr:uncharacterized protein LOC129956571 [Argiope bruennichi]